MEAPWWSFLKAWETIPGALVVAGAVGGYARMGLRVDELEKKMKTLGSLHEQVAKIDERTLTTNLRTTRIEDKLDRILENIPYRRDVPAGSALRQRDAGD